MDGCWSLSGTRERGTNSWRVSSFCRCHSTSTNENRTIHDTFCAKRPWDKRPASSRPHSNQASALGAKLSLLEPASVSANLAATSLPCLAQLLPRSCGIRLQFIWLQASRFGQVCRCGRTPTNLPLGSSTCRRRKTKGERVFHLILLGSMCVTKAASKAMIRAMYLLHDPIHKLTPRQQVKQLRPHDLQTEGERDRASPLTRIQLGVC